MQNSELLFLDSVFLVISTGAAGKVEISDPHAHLHCIIRTVPYTFIHEKGPHPFG